MAIIPNPLQNASVSGATGTLIAFGDLLEAPLQLEPLVMAFAEAVRGDIGMQLRCTRSPAPARAQARIVIELVDELDISVPTALGISPIRSAAPVDERYRLTVAERIAVQAVTEAGIAGGLASLRQMLGAATATARGARSLTPCVIEDGPRFAWRSLKLDVARYFYPVEDIKRVIDQLSRFKLNALQLHLVDNEAWRIDIVGYPEVSAGAGEQCYTQRDLVEIVTYARARGIAVIPEIDLPGHCAALLEARPELGVMQHVEGHDIAYVDPSVPQLWVFLRAVYSQMLELTGSDYLHLGCDEAFRMPAESFTDFVHRASALVRSLGGTPIAYQEASRAGLERGSLAQFWVDFAGPGGLIDELEARASRGEELPFGMKPAAFPFYREGHADLGRAEEQQLGAIVSPTLHAYFDTPFAEPSSDSAQEAKRESIGMSVYAPQPLDAFSDWDPATAFAGLNPALIVGVEAALWSDSVQEAGTMQLLLLPRLPGFAERVWSHRPREWRDFREALAEQAPSWRARGLGYFASSLVEWK